MWLILGVGAINSALLNMIATLKTTMLIDTDF